MNAHQKRIDERKNLIRAWLNSEIRPKLPKGVVLNTKFYHPSYSLLFSTNTNKLIGHINVNIPTNTSTASLTLGRTEPNFRDRVGWGTFMRALGTKIALLNKSIKKVKHMGKNMESLAAINMVRYTGLPPSLITNIYFTNKSNEEIVKLYNNKNVPNNKKVTLNKVKLIKAEYRPISTKIVRKLGFEPRLTKNRNEFISVFSRGNKERLLNNAIQKFLVAGRIQ